MIITKKAIPRRTVLRGLGASLALPLLDGMVPALAATRITAANPVRRLGAIYVPNGMMMNHWTPTTEGTGFDFPRILKPLEPYRSALPRALRDARREWPRAACTLCHAIPHRRLGATGQRIESARWAIHGSDRRARARSRDPARQPRARPRRAGLRRLVRRRVQLRLHKHDLVGERVHTAADGEQPTRGVRAVVRRQWND